MGGTIGLSEYQLGLARDTASHKKPARKTTSAKGQVA